MNAGERFSWQWTVAQVNDEPKLKVVLLYENASIAERALGMLQLTAAEFDGRLDFHSSLWRFDLLEDAALRARATSQIIEADVLIVAVQDWAVPEAIRTWLGACLPQKRDAGAQSSSCWARRRRVHPPRSTGWQILPRARLSIF